MANYNYVVTSKFRPLSYDEMIKPLQQQTDLHNMYEDAYAELATKADALKERAKNEDNSAWAKKYTEYANALEQSVNELATRGLNSMSRRAVNEARRRYASDIVPIQEAIAKQAEIAKTQQSANPTLRMQYSEMPSIDILMGDPNIRPRGYSGSQIEESGKEVGNAAAAREAVNAFIKDPRNAGWMKHVRRQGFTKEAFDELFRHAQEDSNVGAIAQGLNVIREQFGYIQDNSLTEKQKELLDREALAGLFKGAIYQDNSSYQLDSYEMQRLANERQDALRKEEEELLKPREILDKKGNPSGIFYDPRLQITVDKEGRIVNTELNPRYKPEDSSTAIKGVVDDLGNTEKALMALSTVESIKELGWEPVRTVTRHRGQWQIHKQGQDIGEGKHLKQDDLGNYNLSGNSKGTKSTFLGFTESAFSSTYGNTDFTNADNLRLVTDAEFNTLPEEIQNAIYAAAKDAGIPENTSFVVYKKPSIPSTIAGSDKPHDQYLIFTSYNAITKTE